MKRNTKQREAVRLAFLENAHPMRAGEVLRAARKYARSLGIATVYRTLKMLCEEGWLTPVELPGEQVTYYERAQEHHHHFVCRQCERLMRVEGCPPNLAELTPKGFLLEDHELLLYGICAQCRLRRSRRAKA